MKITALTQETQDVVTKIEQGNFLQNPMADIFARNAGYGALKNREETEDPDDAEDISLQKLQNVAEAMDAYMTSLGVNLKFNIDERTDTVQVEVRDPKTDRLIRKIPADEMLELAASIEKMVGLFLDKSL